jgi:hypothetical protein
LKTIDPAQQRNISLKNSAIVSAAVLAALGASTLAYAQNADQDQERLFKEGVYQREQGNLFTSIEAFQTVLSNQPSLNRVRLELAVAYYRTLNFEQAKRQAQMVLDDPKTPENVKLSVLSFLAQVQKDEEAFTGKRQQWEPSVSIGLMHDSNANAGPSSDILPGGLILNDQSRPRSDDAVTLSAGVTHRYQSQTPVKIGEKAARSVWQTQANYYRRNYLNETAFNLDVVTLATGPALLVPNHWRAAVTGQADYIRFGDKELAWFTSLSPSVTWEILGGEITWDALFQHRDFTRSVDAGRDSNYGAMGLSIGKISKSGKYAVQTGARLFKENAGDSRFTNDGTEVYIGLNVLAWQNGAIYARVSDRAANYSGIEPVFGVRRDETEDRYELGFTHDFKQGTTPSHWKLSGSFSHARNGSNVSIYSYKRDITAINLARTF